MLLAAANGNNNFKLVAIFDRGGRMLAARDNITVAFNRDALARELKFDDQPGDGERGTELAWIAIDGNRNHEKNTPGSKSLFYTQARMRLTRNTVGNWRMLRRMRAR